MQKGNGAFSTGFGNYALGVVAHGVSGGVRSVIQGGKFGHGFKSAAVSKAFAPANNKMWPDDNQVAHRVITAAIIGGTTSKLSGGKFENGAAHAAMAQAANEEASKMRAKKEYRKVIVDEAKRLSGMSNNEFREYFSELGIEFGNDLHAMIQQHSLVDQLEVYALASMGEQLVSSTAEVYGGVGGQFPKKGLDFAIDQAERTMNTIMSLDVSAENLGFWYECPNGQCTVDLIDASDCETPRCL